eukprot:tig00000042_g15640.t1
MKTIEKAQFVLLGICIFSCLTLLFEAAFVFRPSFAKVRVTMRGMSDILEGIPRPPQLGSPAPLLLLFSRAVLKQVAKHYTKAQKRDREGDSEEEEGEGGEGGEGANKGGNSSDSSKSEGGGRGKGSGSEDELDGRQKSARSGRGGSRRGRRSGSRSHKERRRAGEDEDSSDSSDEEEEEEEKKKERRMEKKKERNKSKNSKGKKYEVKRGADEATDLETTGAEGGDAAVPVRPASKERGAGLATLSVAVAAPSPAPVLASGSLSAEGAGSRGGSAGSRRASAPPSRGSDRQRLLAGSMAAAGPGPARAPAVVVDLELTSAPLQDILEGLGDAGSGGEDADTLRSRSSGAPGAGGDGDEEGYAVLALPELRDADDASSAAVHVLRAADPDKAELNVASGTPAPASRSSASIASDRDDAGWDPKQEEAEKKREKRRSRSTSLQLTQKPRLARLGSSGGAAGGGILRKAAAEAAAAADGEENDAKAHSRHHHRHKDPKDADEAAKNKAEKRKEKERKKEEEKKKNARKGDEGEKQGADILTKLTYKYTAAFFVIAGIFVVNFVVCFVILDAGKNYSYEINLAGRRRSIAREVAFYARELYINGAIFLPRDDIYARLVKKAALFKQIHQALKFGDPEFHVLGANGRNRHLAEIMYTPSCLRLNEAKCVEGRVADMQLVANGLDALVMGVLDLVVAIQQETAPDLLLTGKEDARYAQSNNFAVQSSKLDLMMEVDDGDLDDGLNRAAAAFVAESLASMAVIEMMEALILTFVILFLLALYIYLFAPMLARLGEETGRAGQILRMLPKDVVFKCVHLHHYFVGIGKDEDE